MNCAAFTPTPTQTPSPGTDETVLSFISQPGDYIGAGESKRYSSEDSSFTVTVSSDHRHFWANVTRGGDWWYLDLASPEGQELTAGVYEGATRYPFNSADTPGLSFSGNGRGCNTLTGRFQVLEAEYDGEAVSRFHATFEQHCEGGTPALFGEIQFVAAAAVPTATATGTSEIVNDSVQESISDAGERAQNTGATITRTLKPNKSLNVLASGCELQIKKKAAKRVVVFCKPNPTPTPTNTTAPSTATVYVRNLTGGTLCYEIHGSGIGQKCFGGGDSLYGTFTSGTYAWSASANCGTANGSLYYPPGTWLVTFACNGADLRQVGEMAPHASDAPN